MLPSPPAESVSKERSKRKIGDVEAEEARDPSFQLENLSDSSSFTFEPICKLLRAHLPLSWLAAAHPTDTLPSSSLLKGAIIHVTSWDYSILVVRLLPNSGLHVLEKVDQDCYVCHTLQPFVTVKWVLDASIGAHPSTNVQMMLHYLPVANSFESCHSNPRRTLSISSDGELKIAKNRKGAAARLSILGQSVKYEASPASPVVTDVPANSDTPDYEQDHVMVGKPEVLMAISTRPDHSFVQPEEVLHEATFPPPDMLSPEYLRQRYLETLYTTRSSLAYYSKGPLSRARARARAPEASLNLGELATFYRESLLPSKKLDLKYKQSIRESMSRILQDSLLEVESTKKSKKRVRLGKNGLWPMELKYIAKWWRKEHNDTAAPALLETHLQQVVCSLRMREAQMQILLILEILSIESKQNANTVDMLKLTDMKIESVEGEESSAQKPQKTAKRRTLDTDLELLADKLCIWHSVGLEDTVLSVSAISGSEPAENQGHSKDSLRDFCTEVLIPFYSSKLPLICKSLCKTLAGPELYDRAAKAARLKDDYPKPVTPGAALQRQPPSRSSTMDRVFSDDNLRHSSPPIFLRSATMPPVTQTKREPSEAPPRHMNRQASMSFTSREVDLVADANMTATKKRKLDIVAMQKQELASAIQALKKPNRQISAMSYMDDVEARKTKLKKPILITATPRTHRKRMDMAFEPAPLSEQFLIPSSGIKQRNDISLPVGVPYSNNKKAVLAALQRTPSKAISRAPHRQPLWENEESAILNTPMVEKDSFDFATPVKPRPPTEILQTPTKQQTALRNGDENEFVLTETALRVMDRAMQKSVSYHGDSIYAQLGWDEDQVIDT